MVLGGWVGAAGNVSREKVHSYYPVRQKNTIQAVDFAWTFQGRWRRCCAQPLVPLPELPLLEPRGPAPAAATGKRAAQGGQLGRQRPTAVG